MATSQIKNILPPTPADFGTPKFFDFKGTTNPGTQQTLIQFTVPIATTRNLWHVKVCCSALAEWQLIRGTDILGSGKLDCEAPESDFFWMPSGRAANPGDTVTLIFNAALGFAPTDLEAYVQAADKT